MRRLLLIGAVALAFPAGASAHATLRFTTPAFGTELQRGPAQIGLHFDQQVKVLPGSIKVLNGVGKQFALPARIEGRTVVADVRPLKLGAYTVRWRAISADSHVVSGVWTFGVRVPAPAVANAYGAGGPTTTEHLVRWLWFLGLALTIGALGLRVICLRGLAVPRALERRIVVAAGLGAVVSLHAGIAAFSLRAEDALQLPFGQFLYGDLSPMAATRFGKAFVVMTLGCSRCSTSPGCSTGPICCCLHSSCRCSLPAVFPGPVTMRSILGRRGKRRSRTGCTSERRRCGSAGSGRWSGWSGTARPSCVGRRSSTSRAWRPC
jgi:methionine-rich copper-binding protein CopC